MKKISVVIITLNEEDTIERCINSVRWVADEILVIDSCSKDLTTSIAQACGARVLQREFTDYVSQRNFAVAQAKHDWVLCIDADEALSKELEINIKMTLSTDEFECYELARQNNYCGKWIRFGALYPNGQIRLFNRTMGKWRGRLIDERWRPYRSSLPVGRLDGQMYHYPVLTWNSYRERVERHADMLAHANLYAGKNYNLLSLLLVPVRGFLYDYFIKLGCLDGIEGFRAAQMFACKKSLVIQRTRILFSTTTVQVGHVASQAKL